MGQIGSNFGGIKYKYGICVAKLARGIYALHRSYSGKLYGKIAVVVAGNVCREEC